MVAVDSRYGLAESTRVTQALASTRSTSVRFPVFANELSGTDPTKIDGFYFIQQSPHLITNVAVGGLDLPLGEPLQEAAASLAVGSRMSVDALEKSIGD
jgi:hypothetical protein